MPARDGDREDVPRKFQSEDGDGVDIVTLRYPTLFDTND